jgi:hypothetical protein
VGGAFSLSPAADAWLDAAAFSGLDATSAVAAAAVVVLVLVVSVGGLGNSWIICACQMVESSAVSGRITSSRRSRMYCSVSGHSALPLPVSCVGASSTVALTSPASHRRRPVAVLLALWAVST